MTRRPLVPLFAIAVLAAASVGASVNEEWLEVQEVLSAPEGRSIEEPIDELIQAAEEIDVRRMTPHAAALVSWSHDRGEMEGQVLRFAMRIDPELPSSYFLLARREWRLDAYVTSAVQYLKGWRALFEYEVTRRHLGSSLGIWLIVGVVCFCAATILAITLRTIRRLVHDAMVLGRLVFERSNAMVFGLVILLLPLFAGLGPVWLVIYLFVLGWIYLDITQRIVAGACCLLLALVPAILESWQLSLLRPPPITDRVAVMLEERELNPSALREFVNLRDDLEGDPLYHLLLGELLRMHSEIEAAKIEFQTASLEAFGDSRSFVILGNMALEDGNVGLAIQHYDTAIDTDGRTALAYHNLSSAYDLNRRFQQGDAARAKARELAGGRSASLGIRGRDPRVRYPMMSSKDVRDLVAGLSREQLLRVGYAAGSWRPMRQFLNPQSVVFWMSAVFGVIVLLVRNRWFTAAKECTKCGKVYRLDDEPGESSVYCRQCVSVFLQRELVPIDQQTAKLSKVRRWDRLSTLGRRLASIVAPGSHQILTDSVGPGVVVGLAVWFLLAGILVWVPRFLGVIEPSAAALPVLIILWIFFLVLWLRSVVVSWQRR